MKQKAEEAKQKEREEEETAALDAIEKFKAEIGADAFSDQDIDLDLQQSLQPFLSTPTSTSSKPSAFPSLSTSIMTGLINNNNNGKGHSTEAPKLCIIPPNEQELDSMSDMETLKHPAIFGIFMRLSGLNEAVIDLEILKNLRVVACFLKYTDIEIDQ